MKNCVIVVLIILFIATLSMRILSIKESLEDIPNKIERDPVYGQVIQSNEPMLVHRYEAGDDVRPDLYEVYYFPEIITNGTKGHYTVFRTLGKDR